MAESRDTHIVEIPVDEEHQQRNPPTEGDFSIIQHHPLTEISQSPGHLLLLKLWQREEDVFGHRIALKETRLDAIRREVFQLCCFFFAFHGFFLSLLFTASLHSQDRKCREWLVPSCLSLLTSFVLIACIQFKIFRYLKVSNQLQAVRSNNRALIRCIQELRLKGASFDLSKEPQAAKRMKSSSVEIKWKPLKWCSQNFVSICLLCFTDVGSSLMHERNHDG